MASVTIGTLGTGAAQAGGAITTAAGTGAGIILVTNDTDSAITFDVATAGTVVFQDQSLQAKSYSRILGLNNGAQTILNVTTAHGTAAQANEVIYVTLIA